SKKLGHPNQKELFQATHIKNKKGSNSDMWVKQKMDYLRNLSEYSQTQQAQGKITQPPQDVATQI
ncbi:hypothetical protein HAX54_014230, partial [Datura stramonium]|nr:hypothetical protein [Datura stramonium]